MLNKLPSVALSALLLGSIPLSAASATPVSPSDDVAEAYALHLVDTWAPAAPWTIVPPRKPSIDPKVALAEGQEFQRIGDYEKAAARYRSIIELRSDSPQAPEARYNLAVVTYLQKDYAGAAQAFVDFRAHHLGHPQADTALFWLAQSHAKSNRASEAAALYQDYAGRHPLVADHVGLLRARLLAELGDAATVLKEVEAIAATSPSSKVAQQAKWLYADTLMEKREFRPAAAAYQELYLGAPDIWAQAQLLHLSAQAWERAGDAARQLQALVALVRDFPRSWYAAVALETLQTFPGAAPTPFQRGWVYFYQRQNSQALQAFQEQARSYPGSAETPWARYLAAIVYERLDRNAEALQELQAVLQESPEHPAAKDALWERSWLLGAIGRYSDAAASYRAYKERFSGTDRAEAARFNEGFMRFKAGDVAGAAVVWAGPPLGPVDGPERGRSAFWEGKALQAMGDASMAQAAYRLAEQTNPGRYYALRARQVRAAVPHQTEGEAWYLLANISITPIDETEALSWLAKWAPLVGDPAAPTAVQGRAEEGQFVQRGALLYELGLWDAAEEEYRESVRVHLQDPAALYVLARLLHEREQHAVAIWAASKLLELAPAYLRTEPPRLLLKILYPAPFLGQVVQLARERVIDPLLLFSLIRQESLFEPRATSGAGAKGLTQVMPATGAEIARKLGLNNFDTDDLYRPMLSIGFGAYYLAQQLTFLAENPFFALAAYNGGAGNALRWMGGDRRADPDFFVESIDYDETALYVRLVMENYAYYQLLYRGN